MHRFLLHNDDIRAAGDLIVSPGQLGLLNGWGVFSTLRVYSGVMFQWERHWARMRRDAVRLRVPFPEDPAWLEQRLRRLIEANQAWNATLRVVIVRNRGGAWLKMWEGPAASREFDAIAFTADVNQWGTARGVRLGLVPNARHAANEFAGAKVLSWSQNLTWFERAHEQGFDEVVLLNERGEVAECTSANIFAASLDDQGDARVWTPPLSSGCLPGVTRAVLIEELFKGPDVCVAQVHVAEKTLMPADLEAADEVFITSTTRELLPVALIDGLKLGSNRRESPSEVRLALQTAFTEHVRAYVATRLAVPAGT
jgi:branched-subunit amino acid aminotransferase/4-amino-4-deoxychorismate lyase